MPTFKISDKKETIIKISAAVFTPMQEKASAFILMQAFQNNVKFKEVDDIVKHKATVAGLKKIFTIGGKSIFSYDSPVDKKSPEGEWLESFFQQQAKMLDEYSNPGWTVFNRDGGFMDFITGLIRQKFNIGKKDTWNPADIWLIKEKQIFREIISKKLKGDSATQTITELNTIMKGMFKKKQVVGISLKKISGKVAQYNEINIDEPFFKKLEKRNGEYSYNYAKANLLLGCDKKTGKFESNDGNIWISDNANTIIYKFQLKGNSTSKFSNLKFEPNARGGAAFLGKAPLEHIEKLVVGKKEVNSLLYNKQTRTHTYYPKNKKEFMATVTPIKGKPTGGKWVDMFKDIISKGVETGNCKTVDQFVTNIVLGFSVSSTPWVAHTKLMVLHFLYYLLQPSKKVRDDLLTDLVFLAAKQGRSVFEYGPFAKLF